MPVSPALAGHAGEAGVLSLLPHEWAGSLALLVLLVVILLAMQALTQWRLRRIERRLRRLESAVGDDGSAPSAETPQD
ncbi:hypothetical protein [Nitrospira sp. Kam-Ns4a]